LAAERRNVLATRGAVVVAERLAPERRDGDVFADGFFAEDFFADGFFAEDFFADDFLADDFLADDFLAEDFFADDSGAEDRVPDDFVAGDCSAAAVRCSVDVLAADRAARVSSDAVGEG
jgi:hypothetical protein